MARCLLLESNFPPSFWAEAIATANYLRNRCPSKSLTGKTLFEVWIGKPPGLHHLKTFGSQGHCLDKTPEKDKFQQHTRNCIFLGYSEESKGYRVWLTNERKIEITGDVILLNEFLPMQNHEEFFSNKDVNRNQEDTSQGEEKTWAEIESIIVPQNKENVVNEIN